MNFTYYASGSASPYIGSDGGPLVQPALSGSVVQPKDWTLKRLSGPMRFSPPVSSLLKADLVGRNNAFAQTPGDTGHQPWQVISAANTTFRAGFSMSSFGYPPIVLGASGGTASGRYFFGPRVPAPFAGMRLQCGGMTFTTTNQVRIGWATTDFSKYLLVRYDQSNSGGGIRLEVTDENGHSYAGANGVPNTAEGTATVPVNTPFVMDISVTNTQCAVLFNGATAQVFDLANLGATQTGSATLGVTTPAVWNTLLPCLCWDAASGNTLTINQLTSGLFGGTALTAQSVVKTLDGHEYQDAEGYVYIQSDICGTGYTNQYQTSEDFYAVEATGTGIFRLNPTTGDVQETSRIFVLHDPAGGSNKKLCVVSELRCVYDPALGLWTLMCAIWGKGASGHEMVLVCQTRANILRGVHLLDGWTRIRPPQSAQYPSMPSNMVNLYEFTNYALWWNRTAGQWQIATMGTGPAQTSAIRQYLMGADITAPVYTVVGSPNTLGGGNTDGICDIRVGDTTYILSTIPGSGEWYQTSTDTNDSTGGLMAAPDTGAVPYGWPTAFKYRNAGKTEFYVFTFDRVDLMSSLPQSYGNHYLFKAKNADGTAQTMTGHDGRVRSLGI